MARMFDRNIFIMLLAVMVGVIVITYFVGDIVNRSKIETLNIKHTAEIGNIEERNIHFTDHFMKSSVLLDSAREDRAFGNYHFDLAFLWYRSALSENNNSTLNMYKSRAVDNCTNAMPLYLNAFNNFVTAQVFFNDTKSYTSYDQYWGVLDLYVGLTGSGARLAMLRYNASKFLRLLSENVSIDGYLGNISDILVLFNETMDKYGEEVEKYDDIQDAIDEYDFFDEIR